MRTHTIAPYSRNYRGRKCSVCKLVCKPNETVVEEGFSFIVHRACLVRWLGASYEDQPVDGESGYVSPKDRRARRQAQEAAEFEQYRQQLVERLATPSKELQ